MKKGTPWSMLVPCLCLILAGTPSPAPAQEGTETRILASAIVDHDVVNVVNEEGEKIGEVDDLIIRRSDVLFLLHHRGHRENQQRRIVLHTPLCPLWSVVCL